MKRGIGLFGGTFDPVHNGHLAVALGALASLGLLRVDFVPAPAPWQKTIFTPLEARVKMLMAAAADSPGLGVNLIEAERQGLTYTFDTLAEMRRRTGPAMPLVLIIGADQWTNFHTWKGWRDFLSLASIALCNREGENGSPSPEVAAWARGRWCERHEIAGFPAGRITRFEIPAHEASSTKIREVFALHPLPEALRMLETWLPPPVAAYIGIHGTYGKTSSLEERKIG